MLGRILELFAPGRPEESSAPRPDRIEIATCAVLLEVANIDDEFSDSERDHVVATLRRQFELSEAEAHALIEETQAVREKATDIWHFTHRINEVFSAEEKLRIVEEVWRVVYADGTLTGHEDHLMHRLQHLLNISHPQLIKAKLAARDGQHEG